VLAALDKASLAAAADRAGLPGPAGTFCTGEDAAIAAADELGYPVIVKSESSFVTEDGRTRQHVAAFAAGPDDVRRAAARIGGPALVQRFQRAHVLSYAGVRYRGRVLALAVSEFVRTWPPLVGSASLAVMLAPDPEVRRRAEAILDDLDWQGIFQLQLLRAGDGPSEPIDLNPRPYASLGHALAAGANLAAIWCDALRGNEPAETVLAQPGITYRWGHGEIGNVATALARHRPLDALAILAPHAHTVYPFFSARDPAPLAARALAARNALPALLHLPR
jgi:predicted ATP-grasp superfamily ATP-dependent carboligase